MALVTISELDEVVGGTPVPEPTSLALFGTGALTSLLASRRRRRR